MLAEGSPVSAGTEVVETCSGASSSLLHNHCVDYSPELTNSKVMSASVLKGQPVDPRGLCDPQIVNKIQVERRWRDRLNEPNTAGTSGHAAFPRLGGKRANNIRSYSSYVSRKRPLFGLKPHQTVKYVVLFLPNVTLWRFWSMLRTAALNLYAQLSSVFYKLASS